MRQIAPLLSTMALVIFSVAGMPAQAQQPPEQASNLLSTGTGSTGRIAVNISAGSGNAQANTAAIAVSEDRAMAVIGNAVPQPSLAPSAGTAGNSQIGADAFRNASGLVSVNQSSGNGNAQANLAGVAISRVSEVSFHQLGEVGALTPETGPTAGSADRRSQQTATIADSAFSGAHGLVQVNQLAGSGNRTMNVFALSIGAGTQ